MCFQYKSIAKAWHLVYSSVFQLPYTRLLPLLSVTTPQLPIAITKSWRGRHSTPGRKKDVIPFSIASLPALTPTRLPIPGVAGEFSRWLKSSEHEADHEPPYNAEVKGECSCTRTPPHALMMCRGMYSFLPYVMESTLVNVQSLDEEYL